MMMMMIIIIIINVIWVLGAVFLGVKRLGHETSLSPSYSADVKNGGTIPSLPHTSYGVVGNLIA
jgi:hypothetical protein